MATRPKSMRYDLGGFFNKLREERMDNRRALNAYQYIDPLTKKKTILRASGFELAKDLTATNSYRASIVRAPLAYVVIGDEVIELDQFLGETVRGTIGTTSGYVGVSQNRNEIMFVDGTGGWVWNTDTLVFTAVVFAGLPFFPVDITNINGYFIAVDNSTNSIDWRISDLDDGLTWSATNFVAFLSPGDTLAGVRALHKRAFIFGNLNTQIWYNGVGFNQFPFLEDTSVLFEHGLAAVGSLRESFELMFYISKDASGPSGVQMIAGVLPRKISTPAIDLFLQELTAIEDCQAILYKETGLIFYQLNFTTDRKSLLYVSVDTRPLTIGRWSTLGTFDGNRHIAATHFFFTNKHYIGSYIDQKLYEVSYKFGTYGGDVIHMDLIGPLLEAEDFGRIRMDKIEIVAQPGLLEEPVANPEDEPTLLLSVSRDGGKTFGNETRHSLGNTAEYKDRLVRYNLGDMRCRDVYIRIQSYNRSNVYIYGVVLAYGTA